MTCCSRAWHEIGTRSDRGGARSNTHGYGGGKFFSGILLCNIPAQRNSWLSGIPQDTTPAERPRNRPFQTERGTAWLTHRQRSREQSALSSSLPSTHIVLDVERLDEAECPEIRQLSKIRTPCWISFCLRSLQIPNRFFVFSNILGYRHGR